MSSFDSSSKLPKGQVDWSDPRLDALLRKTESWSLDNRGGFPAVEVLVQLGWGHGDGRVAKLVYEADSTVVLEMPYSLPKGEPVRIDRMIGGALRASWGTVVDGREGYREEDRKHGIYVHWIHVR